MIHSLYNNKEIFLPDLLCNASDALDRLRLSDYALLADASKPEDTIKFNRLMVDLMVRTL